jgi:uncharacterized protein
MYIPQKQLKNLKDKVGPGKVMVIYGPRRVGKTTLVKKFIESIPEKVLLVNGDDIVVREYLESQSIRSCAEDHGREPVGESAPAEGWQVCLNHGI